jgi:hypothetical protein
LRLETDASGIATGGVLYQEIDGKRYNLFYHSKILSPIEQRYLVPEREAVAILHCLQRMRTLVLGRTVHIQTDHCPIFGMLQKPVNNRWIARVANLIQEYQIAGMKHIDGKVNCLADYLSRLFIDSLFDTSYGVDSKQSVPLATDSGVSLSSSHDLLSTMTLRSRYRTTPLPADNKRDMDEEHSTQEAIMTPSSHALDSSTVRDEQLQDPEIVALVTRLNDRYPDSSTLLSSFAIHDNTLFRIVDTDHSSSQPNMVLYLPSSMIQRLLIAMHDDPYQGGHFSTDKMVSKIRTRYWWSRMRQTIQRHVQACHPCQ